MLAAYTQVEAAEEREHAVRQECDAIQSQIDALQRALVVKLDQHRGLLKVMCRIRQHT
jgi:hypothetical protein